jgi:hypothetical protein
MMRIRHAVLGILLFLTACSITTGGQAIYVLVDVSGTYHRQLPKAVQAVQYLLAKSKSADFLAVAKIASRSFSNKEIVFAERLPDRPREANAKKLFLKNKIDELAKSRATNYTDIRGALYQVAHTLAEQDAHHKIIILFSDLVEDITKDIDRKMKLPDLSGVHVLAVNVIKLRSDNKHPEKYYARLDKWKQEFLDAGAASFRVLDDPASLQDAIRQIK